MAVLPVYDHGHALARLVDPDQDIRASVAQRRQHRYRDRERGRGGCSTHCKSSKGALRTDTSTIGHRMHYHLQINALLPWTRAKAARPCGAMP
jgi:hypothetical protein